MTSSARRPSRGVLKVDERQSTYYHLVLGGEEIGWIIVANENWEQEIDPALTALGQAMAELIELEDPRVNDILERHSIRYKKPGEDWR